MKRKMHFIILDNRIKHNKQKNYKRELFFYIKHFLKNKKEFKMSYYDIIKQARGIAKRNCEMCFEVQAISDACRGIRY